MEKKEAENKEIAIKGMAAAGSFRVSLLMDMYGLTSEQARQLKARAVQFVPVESARRLFNAGLCSLHPNATADERKEVSDG